MPEPIVAHWEAGLAVSERCCWRRRFDPCQLERRLPGGRQLFAATLTSTNLSGSDLSYAALTANLTGANLASADCRDYQTEAIGRGVWSARGVTSGAVPESWPAEKLTLKPIGAPSPSDHGRPCRVLHTLHKLS